MAFVRNPVKPDGKPLLSPGQWRAWAVSLLQPAAVGRWVVVVNIVLLALIAYSLAKLTWMLVPAPPEEASAPPPIVAPAAPGGVVSPAASHTPSPQEMAQWHLFGEVQVINVGAAANAAPQTSLALSLRGVIASRGKATARAIIADSTGNEQFYAIDAPLPGGAILKEIRADRVILLRDGRYETLLLPKDEMEGESMPGAAPPPDAAMMQEFRDTLASNPQSLMERVHPVPVSEGGKFVGYRFLPGQDPTFLARFGMEPNDIVTAVNGMSLDNPAKGMQLLNSLKTEGEVRVETLRNGAPRSFILRMNQ
ncbi:MAG: type II secretion system protein GspC [Gammaproteobacteria bacterium]|nr:type II secretion system protein GspC [Gammaproteobacteria bacterium]